MESAKKLDLPNEGLLLSCKLFLKKFYAIFRLSYIGYLMGCG